MRSRARAKFLGRGTTSENDYLYFALDKCILFIVQLTRDQPSIDVHWLGSLTIALPYLIGTGRLDRIC